MVKPSSHIPEGIINLAHTIVETERLRSWFFALETLPPRFAAQHLQRWQHRCALKAKIPTLAQQSQHLSTQRCMRAFLKLCANGVDEATPTI